MSALVSATHLDDLLDDLVEQVPGAEFAILLSADGLPLAGSAAVTAETAETIAATAAGLHALATAVGRQLDGGRALRSIVEMEHVLLAVEPAGEDAVLAVTFGGAPDPEAVNGPVSLAADRAARLLAAEADQ
jgi:predicted regulator of Ras-like GTPase activity (Roadblock/LC7/MglB family)